MYHQFWIFSEEKYDYSIQQQLWGRHDAPLHIADDLLRLLNDSFCWIPTLHPWKGNAPMTGWNLFEVTIVNHTGALALQQVCLGWAQLFSLAPEHVRLRLDYVMSWISEDDKSVLHATQLSQLGTYEYREFSRDQLVSDFTLLSQFAAQAATGEYFVVHLGI